VVLLILLLYFLCQLSANQVGEQILMFARDPGIIKIDGIYYMTSEGEILGTRVALHASTDLRSWRFIKFLFDEENYPTWALSRTRFFGPNIHKIGNAYNIYSYIQNKASNWTVGVATGPTPIGPFFDIGYPLLTEDKKHIYEPNVVKDGKLLLFVDCLEGL